MSRLILLSCFLAALGGCADISALARLQPGVTRETAIAKAGPPNLVWHNADGSQTLEYSNQPFEGRTCYQVDVNANGIVADVLHVSFDDASFARVKPDMTMEQVRRLLCEPRTVAHYTFSDQIVWDWNTDNEQGLTLAPMRFNAYFRNGRVVRTNTILVHVEM